MNKISCDVCLDLIPLVKDGVASRDSIALVKEHIAECPDCKAFYDKETAVNIPDDRRIIKKIGRNTFLLVLMVVLLGISIGLTAAENSSIFYNILVLTAIGIFGYFYFKERACIVPVGVFILYYIGMFIITAFKLNMEDSGMPWLMSALLMPVFYSFIYSVLSAIGVIIGWCFNFAFKKEEKK